MHFHQLAPGRVTRPRTSACRRSAGREVDYAKIQKGYETGKGKYVVFEPGRAQGDARRPRRRPSTSRTSSRSRTSIRSTTNARTTWRRAATGRRKAYALLAAVMEERERIGIGKVVMREKQHLAAIRPYGKGLALSTMLFADEVVAVRRVGRNARAAADPGRRLCQPRRGTTDRPGRSGMTRETSDDGRDPFDRTRRPAQPAEGHGRARRRRRTGRVRLPARDPARVAARPRARPAVGPGAAARGAARSRAFPRAPTCSPRSSTSSC